MQGLTAFNSALVPELKPVDAKIHNDVTCGDLAAKVMAIANGAQNGAAPTASLSPQQVLAIVQFCEQRDATTTLQLDPQGARKVLEGLVNKPSAGLTPGSVVAPAAAAAIP
jgi:hypothetical protein